MENKCVLLVEDNGVVISQLKERLIEKGIDVKMAYSYLSAIGVWKRHSNDIACMILDLNINPDGLSPETNGKYYPLNALAILEDIGWIKNPSIIPKVFVYSGYTDDLKPMCIKFNIPYARFDIIPKHDPNGIRKLVQKVCETI